MWAPPLQGRCYQYRTGQDSTLSPKVQTSFCVGVKRENKSLINVCCVVDDFVATSVANGLCMRNNGLLAEREIA